MQNYVPEHKSDVNAVAYLKSLPFETVKADVPRLLECIQDLHWDIAHGVADYLVPHIREIQQQLIYIFETNDEEWKYNAIVALIRKSPNEIGTELRSIIKKIAAHPTKGEKDEDVDEAAKKVIADNNW